MNSRSNAYTEVYTILQDLNEEEYNKIPPEIIETLELNRNKEYEYELDEDLELKEQQMLPETKAILFNIFRDYLSTPEQKQKIIRMQAEERQKKEQEKEELYSKDIAFNNKESKEETKQINKTALVKYKNKAWYKKVIYFIENIFSKLFKQN